MELQEQAFGSLSGALKGIWVLVIRNKRQCMLGMGSKWGSEQEMDRIFSLILLDTYWTDGILDPNSLELNHPSTSSKNCCTCYTTVRQKTEILYVYIYIHKHTHAHMHVRSHICVHEKIYMLLSFTQLFWLYLIVVFMKSLSFAQPCISAKRWKIIPIIKKQMSIKSRGKNKVIIKRTT